MWYSVDPFVYNASAYQPLVSWECAMRWPVAGFSSLVIKARVCEQFHISQTAIMHIVWLSMTYFLKQLS